MAEFERENRYIVIKRSDLDKLYKDPTKYATTFGHALALIAPHLPPRQFVVVESDWPEYNLVWMMLEHRMAGNPVPDFNAVRHTEELRRALAGLLFEFDDGVNGGRGERVAALDYARTLVSPAEFKA
jgi:hypothetical protein